MFFMVQLHPHAVDVQACVYRAGHDSTGVMSGQHGTFQGCASSSSSSLFFSGGPLAPWLETRLDYGKACLQSYIALRPARRELVSEGDTLDLFTSRMILANISIHLGRVNNNIIIIIKK